MGNFKFMQIETVKTFNKGSLSFLELGKDINFEIKRIYYIHQVLKETKRGGHAHRKLKQVLFCPYGEIKIILDDGMKKETILLDSPEKVIIVEGLIWRDMVWKKENSVLCVGASDVYDESDYIRNYDDFLEAVKGGY